MKNSSDAGGAACCYDAIQYSFINDNWQNAWTSEIHPEKL